MMMMMILYSKNYQRWCTLFVCVATRKILAALHWRIRCKIEVAKFAARTRARRAPVWRHPRSFARQSPTHQLVKMSKSPHEDHKWKRNKTGGNKGKGVFTLFDWKRQLVAKAARQAAEIYEAMLKERCAGAEAGTLGLPDAMIVDICGWSDLGEERSPPPHLPIFPPPRVVASPLFCVPSLPAPMPPAAALCSDGRKSVRQLL